mmetsp:Transcript_52539/g.112368  ORF Transcript_52539/g.112368 Transcript_52539/m.112368 type:complete len:259 (-) Transcript_52539:179-955(-)
MAVLDCAPVLCGTHPEGVRDRSYHPHHVLQSSDNDPLLKYIVLKLGSPIRLVHGDEGSDVLDQVLFNVFELAAVKAPPDPMVQGPVSKATEVKNPAVQLPLVIPPEIRIVHVQVLVPERQIIDIGMFPIINLCRVRRQSHHRIHKLRYERLLGHILGEDDLGGLREELDPNAQLRDERLGRHARTCHWVHTPTCRVIDIRHRGHHVTYVEVHAAHQPLLRGAPQLCVTTQDLHVVILCGAFQLKVLALLVGTLDQPRR